MSEKSAGGGAEWSDPDDAPELTEEFFDRADLRLGGVLVRRGRPPSGKAKRLVSLRIDPDVLQRLRRLGAGWQTRAAEALRALADASPSEGSGAGDFSAASEPKAPSRKAVPHTARDDGERGTHRKNAAGGTIARAKRRSG